MMPAAPPSQLQVGAGAPEVPVTTLAGTQVILPTHGEWTLVSFLRYASCPACNLRVRELRSRERDLRAAGVKWFAVFHSPELRLKQYMPPDSWSSIIPDPEGALGRTYRTTRSWLGLGLTVLVPSFYWAYLKTIFYGYWGGAVDKWLHGMPADFLIGPDGTLVMCRYGRHIVDHPDVDEILAVVMGANAGEPTRGATIS